MDLATIGHSVLYAAFGSCVWSLTASITAVLRKDSRYAASGRRALYAAGGLIATATLLLLVGLVRRDFSLLYVASYTSRSTPRLFAVASLWAGMEGSLLWWTCITAIYAVTTVAFQARRGSRLVHSATAVLSAIIAAFLALIAFGANPFQIASPVPVDGAGLNPLLHLPSCGRTPSCSTSG